MEIPTLNFYSFPFGISFQMVLEKVKKISRVYLDMNPFFHCKQYRRRQEDLLCMDHSLHHSLLNLTLYKKACLNLLLLVFFLFFFRLSLSSASNLISLIFDILLSVLLLNALSLISLLLITLTLFSLLVDIFSLVSHLNTLVLLLSLLFDAFSLGIFIFFLESKKECKRTHSLVVSNLHSKTKCSLFKFGCYLFVEVRSLQ